MKENNEQKPDCTEGCKTCNCCNELVLPETEALPCFKNVFPKIRLEFVNKSPNPDPSYAKKGDSCFDVASWIDQSLYENETVETDKKGGFIRLKPMECKLIHTGLYFKIPSMGMEIQTRSRSGRSLHVQVVVLNSPGTVDQEYRGELGIILMNLGQEDYLVYNNDKIAQCGLYPVFNEPMVDLVRVSSIDTNTDRAAQGFGHSDKKE